MFIVEWTDHEGNLQQRTLNTPEDAQLEAASLKKKFDYVAIITEVENALSNLEDAASNIEEAIGK